MKAINKKIVIIILVILEMCSIYLMYKSYSNKNILDNKIETKEKMAIKVINDNGEYESKNQLPGEGYVLNKELTECKNQEGKKVENLKLTSNGESITITSTKTLYCTLYFDLPESREYDYTGDYQVFMAPKEGDYQIELWGASGGEVKGGVFMTLDNSFGRGAYTKGTIHLTKNEKLYVYVGENSNVYGGDLIVFPFNGGGPGESSGGGATDVRLNISSTGNWDDFNSLKSRIMVAAGGGGGAYYLDIDTSKEYTRGDGGTLNGIDARFFVIYYSLNTYDYSGHGGTQTSGGSPGTKFDNSIDPERPEMTGKFGKGGYGINANDDYTYTSSGGGGGYYGGGHGNHPGGTWTGGGGGSSFISGHTGCVAIKESSTEENVQIKDGCSDGTEDINCSYHYSNKVFTETEMIAGDSLMPTHDGKDTMTGNTGNGYAKITFVK